MPVIDGVWSPDDGAGWTRLEQGGFVDGSGNRYNADGSPLTAVDPTPVEAPAPTIMNPNGSINSAAAVNDPRGAQGAITRAQYQEWLNTFQPVEGDLMSMTTYNGNPGLASGIIEGQRKNIDTNFGVAQGVRDRTMAGYGMQMTAEQQDAADAGMALDKSKAVSGMVAQTNRWQDDLNRRIMASGASAMGAVNTRNSGV